MKIAHRKSLAMILMIGAVLGCNAGDGGDTGPSVAPIVAVPVAIVSITPASLTLRVAATEAFAATARDAAGNALTGRTVLWRSSRPEIASIDAAGVATAVSPGTATVSATVDGQVGSAAVTVIAPVASIQITPPSAILVVGERIALSATMRDANGTVLTERVVTWTSGNPLVATVSTDGVVTAVSAGTTSVTATAEGISAQSSIRVNQPPPPRIPSVRADGLEVARESPDTSALAASFSGDTNTFSWDQVPNASTYLLEVGLTPGASDVLRRELSSASYRWSAVPQGTYFLQVTATNSGSAARPSPPLEVFAVDLKQYVEWLFFGTGPYGLGDCGNPATKRMAGWAPGTTIRMIAAADLHPTDLRAAQQMASEMHDVTAGVLSASFMQSTAIDPQPRVGELTVAHFRPGDGRCPGSAVGCFTGRVSAQGVTLSGQVYLDRAEANGGPTPHELGHALYGMCHHSDRRIARLTTMGYGGRIGYRVTSADRRAVRAVYLAGLRPGATRAQFVQAGLLNR
jgi:hypothetical protein